MSLLDLSSRRRAPKQSWDEHACPSSSSKTGSKSHHPLNTMSLRKGATFQSPKSPSSPVDDPILDIRSLPRRSPTSPDTLKDIVAASDDFEPTDESRATDIINEIARLTGSSEKDALPVPQFLVDHAAAGSDLRRSWQNARAADPKDKAAASKQPQVHVSHDHLSDSGLGASISEQRNHFFNDFFNFILANYITARSDSVYSHTTSSWCAINKSSGSSGEHSAGTGLSDHAVKKIHDIILLPILSDDKFEHYHPLVRDIPQRIGEKKITCLRDLEKTIVFLAPVSTNFADGEKVLAECFLLAKSRAKSARSYLNFCRTSIQHIHTAVEHLNDRDLRRPTDKPYTNNYFVDLVAQVRQYACLMAASRQKQLEGQQLDKNDFSALVSLLTQTSTCSDLLTQYIRNEKLHLRGGATENGQPVELVREKDGEVIPINAPRKEVDLNADYDEEVERTMARKRKCDIGKVEYRYCRECGKSFTRHCDLAKHEKTHSRPFKCDKKDCKYNDLGWPTQKELERHTNDKHNHTPALYRCLFAKQTGCPYTSKRESNCKQHMEKAHGWEYVRSKSRKGPSLVPTVDDTSAGTMPTPSSAIPSLSTPQSAFTPSPLEFGGDDLSNAAQMQTPSSGLFPTDVSPITNNFDGGLNSRMPNSNLFGFENFNQPLQQPVQSSMQESSNERRHSEDMFDTFFEPSMESSVPASAWDLNMDDMEMDMPLTTPPEEFFNNHYTNAQQPTPALTDMHFDLAGQGGDLNFGSAFPGAPNVTNNLSPAYSHDLMATNSHNSLQLPGTDTVPSDDFTLFGDELGPPGGGNSGAAGRMFPELNIGGQFQNSGGLFDGAETDPNFPGDFDLKMFPGANNDADEQQ